MACDCDGERARDIRDKSARPFAEHRRRASDLYSFRKNARQHALAASFAAPMGCRSALPRRPPNRSGATPIHWLRRDPLVNKLLYKFQIAP